MLTLQLPSLRNPSGTARAFGGEKTTGDRVGARDWVCICPTRKQYGKIMCLQLRDAFRPMNRAVQHGLIPSLLVAAPVRARG